MMRMSSRTAVAATVAMLASFLALTPRAQVQKIDAEKLLAERFGYTPAEIDQARSGRAVTKLLPTREQGEAGVVGAVRVSGTPDRLLYWLRDIAAFRKAAELGLSKKLSNPPQVNDFADLSLDAGELAALKACRPGKCGLRLGDRAIARYQTEVPWTSPDAATRANLLTRQLMLGLAHAYLQGGDLALGTAHNEKKPRVSVDEFHALLYQATNVYELAPSFAAYLEHFPGASLPDSEQFLYWSHGGTGPDASIGLHQVVIGNPPGGSILIADKQLYASRYTDAALTVISLAPAREAGGYYVLAGARARSTMLGGTMARMLRTRIERAALEIATMYLDWIQQSLALTR